MSAAKLNKFAGARILSRTSRTRAIFREGRPLPDGRGTDRRRGIAHGHLVLGFLAVLPVVAVGAAAGRSATGTYTIIDLGTLGGLTSVALGINKVGQVCGGADMADGKRHAFLWEDGVMTDLGTNPPTSQSEAWGINNAGTIVGSSSNTGNPARGFIWENGEMTTLVDPPTATTGLAINDHRQVVGIYGAPGGWHAFHWEDGVLTDLGTLGGSYSIAWDINDAGQIVGSSFTEVGQEAFLWEDGGMSELVPLGGQTEAFGINEAGQVVGHSHPMGSFTPVLWEDGGIVDLGALIEDNVSTANAINDTGQILMWGDMWGYLYDIGTGTGAHLQDLLPPDSHWSELLGRDMNDAGQIVGAGTIDGQRHAFLMTPPPPIPTVSAWGGVLMVLALVTAATIVFGTRKHDAILGGKEA